MKREWDEFCIAQSDYEKNLTRVDPRVERIAVAMGEPEANKVNWVSTYYTIAACVAIVAVVLYFRYQ